MLVSTSVLIHTRIFQAQPPLPAQLLTQVWGSAQTPPSREPGGYLGCLSAKFLIFTTGS